jgi:hypothetical protein
VNDPTRTGAPTAHIRRHPSQNGHALIDIPASANHLMAGKPVTFDRDHRAFLIARDDLGAFIRWWQFYGGPLVDTSAQVQATKPLECGNVVAWLDVTGHEVEQGTPGAVPDYCGAAYANDRESHPHGPATHAPTYCGKCGQPARPRVFEDTEPLMGQPCPACRHHVLGGAAYCTRCGAPMPVRETVRPHALAAIAASEPAPLAAGFADVVANLGGDPETAPEPPEHLTAVDEHERPTWHGDTGNAALTAALDGAPLPTGDEPSTLHVVPPTGTPEGDRQRLVDVAVAARRHEPVPARDDDPVPSVVTIADKIVVGDEIRDVETVSLPEPCCDAPDVADGVCRHCGVVELLDAAAEEPAW